MAYYQVRDILERVQRFHEELSAQYAALSVLHEDERVRLLMARGRAREEAIARLLDPEIGAKTESVLDTWIQNLPDTDLTLPEIGPSTERDVIIARVLEKEKELNELFTHLAESRAAPSVQEFFQSLLDLESSAQEEVADASPPVI